jgi:hypothetical protein
LKQLRHENTHLKHLSAEELMLDKTMLQVDKAGSGIELSGE